MVIGKKMFVTDNQPGQFCISFSVKTNTTANPVSVPSSLFLLLFAYATSHLEFRIVA